jgi:molybdopterin-guanine dinucleotide biosynthesis protein A
MTVPAGRICPWCGSTQIRRIADRVGEMDWCQQCGRVATVSGIAGVLLAGGLGRRMGGGADKPLRLLAGRSLLAHAVQRAAPQVGALVLNVNTVPAAFTDYGLPLVADPIAGYAGPLAGVLAGMEWAAARGCQWLVSFATDAPFLPRDLVTNLVEAVRREDADIGCARSGGRVHPVFALWPVHLAETLRRAMVEEQMRKVDLWTSRFRVAYADWPDQPFDPFFNVNTPEDLAAAEGVSAD